MYRLVDLNLRSIGTQKYRTDPFSVLNSTYLLGYTWGVIDLHLVGYGYLHGLVACLSYAVLHLCRHCRVGHQFLDKTSCYLSIPCWKSWFGLSCLLTSKCFVSLGILFHFSTTQTLKLCFLTSLFYLCTRFQGSAFCLVQGLFLFFKVSSWANPVLYLHYSQHLGDGPCLACLLFWRVSSPVSAHLSWYVFPCDPATFSWTFSSTLIYSCVHGDQGQGKF